MWHLQRGQRDAGLGRRRPHGGGNGAGVLFVRRVDKGILRRLVAIDVELDQGKARTILLLFQQCLATVEYTLVEVHQPTEAELEG